MMNSVVPMPKALMASASKAVGKVAPGVAEPRFVRIRLDHDSTQRLPEPRGTGRQHGIHVRRTDVPCALVDLLVEFVRRPDHQPHEVARLVWRRLDDVIDGL